ncbi:MAG: phosphoribosylanthranilate isomerase [Gemmatimonadaceae bacterium]|nr:phosphoribosylanthranilate isomerase [Gemmatimonadaceae bacterium]
MKFCGLTLPGDAAFAGEAGASYVGAVLAGGPRSVTAGSAAEVFAAAPAGVTRVAVLGAGFREILDEVLDVARPDVVQLHADPDVNDVIEARRLGAPAVWAVVRIVGTELPGGAAALLAEADALLLDAKVDGSLGGSGAALGWAALAGPVERIRRGGKLVLAGGLRPGNVRDAVAALQPDVVDVSSGVERSPGIKDHDLMLKFVTAARRQVR